MIPLLNPVSLKCNLRCKYCFHRYKKKRRSEQEKSLMELDLIKSILTDLCLLEKEEIEIIWHGGEPLLAGKKFFQEVFKIQKELSRIYNKKFVNNIQTNATTIDDEW